MLAPRIPIGIQLTSAARAIERAFEAVLDDAGGSIVTWRILLHLKLHGVPSQRALADAIGVETSTLSVQLSDMERNGLITRRRDPEDQRTQIVELTSIGEAAFARIRSAAGAFDSLLRRGLREGDATELERILSVLVDNAAEAKSSAH
jgi:MarR family transcriptional regulator, transcriptional regulator for hemolysin